MVCCTNFGQSVFSRKDLQNKENRFSESAVAPTARTRGESNSANFGLRHIHDRNRMERRKLLRPNSEDFPALNLDFDAEGRTQIGALYDRSSDPDASRKIGQFERVKDSAAAGVSDHGMFGGAKTIVIFKLVQLRDVFELAIAVRRILCKGPITAGL